MMAANPSEVASTTAAFFQNIPYIVNPNQPAAAVCEQSTLIYTIAPNCTELSWDEFSLIIRSLHSYKVVSFKEDQASGSISVTVGYFANTSNARKRLGNASEHISVSRLSGSVQINELQALQQLRTKFGFGGPVEEEECPPPSKNGKSGKRKKYAPYNRADL